MESGRLQKGRISALLGPENGSGNPTMARVVPQTAPGRVTPPLVLAWQLRGGTLEPQAEVVFAVFEDGSGMVLAKADGEP